MGEYSRLNRMLEQEQKRYQMLKSIPNKTDADYDLMTDISQNIGEIKGALLEMADVDGLDDPYEAFDY